MVFAHITNFDVASLLPSAVAILVLGVAIGVAVAPRFVKKFSKRGDC
jgi:hypothetical protein